MKKQGFLLYTGGGNMRWLERTLLVFGAVAGLGVLALDWQLVVQLDGFAGAHAADLRVLALLLFGLAGLYSLLLILMPSLHGQLLKREAERVSERVAEATQSQLRVTLAELAALRAEIAELVRGASAQTSTVAVAGSSDRDRVASRRRRVFRRMPLRH